MKNNQIHFDERDSEINLFRRSFIGKNSAPVNFFLFEHNSKTYKI